MPLKNLAESSTFSLLSNVARRGIGYLLLPVYTSYLSVEDYGTISVYEYTQHVLGFFVTLYIEQAYVIEKTKANANQGDGTSGNQLLGIYLGFILLWNLFFLPLVALLLWNFDILPQSKLHLIIVLVVTQLLWQVSMLFYAHWKTEYKANRVILLENVTFLVNVVFSLTFLVLLNMGWVSNLYGGLVASTVQLLSVSFLFAKNERLSLGFQGEAIRKSVKIGLSLIPNAALILSICLLDRILLKSFDSLESVGLYSLAFKFLLILIFSTEMCLKIVEPYMFSRIETRSEGMNLGLMKVYYTFFIGTALIYVSIATYIHELIRIIANQTYHDVDMVFILLGITYVFYPILKISVSILSFLHKLKFIISVSLFHLAVHIMLCFWLIPEYGLNGDIAINIVLMFVFSLFLLFWSSKQLGVGMSNYVSLLRVMAYFLWIPVVFFLNSLEIGFTLRVLLKTAGLLLLLYWERDLLLSLWNLLRQNQLQEGK